jgi:hypothetical protein
MGSSVYPQRCLTQAVRYLAVAKGASQSAGRLNDYRLPLQTNNADNNAPIQLQDQADCQEYYKETRIR